VVGAGPLPEEVVVGRDGREVLRGGAAAGGRFPVPADRHRNPHGRTQCEHRGRGAGGGDADLPAAGHIAPAQPDDRVGVHALDVHRPGGGLVEQSPHLVLVHHLLPAGFNVS
jgi:hypothetical protein